MKTAILQSFKKKKKRTVDSKGEGQVCPSQAAPLTNLPLAPRVRKADSGPRGTDASTECCTEAA